MQLLQIYDTNVENKHMDEDAAFFKYGQRKYVRAILILSILTVSFAVLTFVFKLIQPFPDIDLANALFVINMFTLILSTIVHLMLFVCSLSLLSFAGDPICPHLEFTVVLCVSFVVSIIYHAPMINAIRQDKLDSSLTTFGLCAMALMFRNLLCIVLSIAYPIQRTNRCYLIPYGETRECAKSLELVLCSRLAYQCFAGYVKEELGAEGERLTSLYNQLKLYEHKINKRDPACEMGREIIGSCEGIGEIVKIPRQTLEEVKERNKELEGVGESRHLKNIFAPVLVLVMEKLQELFKSFKETEWYEELIDNLMDREIVNERLQQANVL